MSQAKQFFPGVIDYDGGISANYREGRALSSETARAWTAIVAAFVHDQVDARIVDLGAGTGRFSALFARAFEAHVVALEPATSMLTVAKREVKPRNLAYVAASAERIPLSNRSCDVAWLSHVWHHIGDHRACVIELRRILRPHGLVLVRGTFGDQLDGFPTLFRYWPAARDICRQLPTIQQTVGVFGANGFALTEHRRIQQTTSDSLSEFAKRTRLRADTALALISDSEFCQGQAAIESAAAQEREPAAVVEEIEFLVFRR